MKPVTTIISVLLALVVLSGCKTTHYKIELRPHNDGLERTLTIWQTPFKPSDPPKDFLSKKERTRLQSLFDHNEYNVEEGRHLFRGMVKEKTLPDIGGTGSYLRLANPMGVAFVYLERFRGEDDQAKIIEKSLVNIDQLSGHLVDWLQTEVSAKPGWEVFKNFLKEDFPRDLKNIYLYFRSLDAADNFGSNLESYEIMEKAEGALFARVIQYLFERDYISLRDIPELQRLFDEQASSDRLFEFLQVQLSKKLKTDLKPMFRHLGELFRNEKVQASVVAYFKKTPAYQKKLEAWHQSHPESENPSPASVIDELIDDLTDDLFVEIFTSSSFPVEVQLFLASEPEYTNGHWEDGKVAWRGNPQENLESPSDVPMLCYALWTQPNEKFQETRFGRVVLEGETLIEYSSWYESLTTEEVGKWDDHLTSMRPGPDLVARLRDFRFVPLAKDSQSKDKSPADYSDQALELILSALKGE